MPVVIRMRVVPAPDDPGTPVISEFLAGDYILEGRGNTDFACGACGRVLLRNAIWGSRIQSDAMHPQTGAVFKCSCGQYNEFPVRYDVS